MIAVFLRVAVLVFWVAFSWAMGQEPSSGLNAFGKSMAASFFVAAPSLYFLPTYEAARLKHVNLTSIGMLNLFLGWTLLGWVWSLVWALRKGEPTPTYAAVQRAPVRSVRACPFCAEEILAAARKCKHCGSEVEPLG